MEKRAKNIIRLLSKEYQPAKLSLQSLATRLVIGFFTLMLVLTVVSKAADSVTVAKVRVARIKSGVLSYEVRGDGTIEAEAEEYINLYEGVKIEGIAVKAGETVKEGDLLFYYDLQELERIRENRKDAYTIAQLNLEKDQLNYEATVIANEAEGAQILLGRAELDLELAQKELDMAKNKTDENIIDRLQTAKENYNLAKAGVTDALEGREYALSKLGFEIAKAEKSVEKYNKANKELEAALTNYKNAVLNRSERLPEPRPEAMLGSMDTAIDLNIRDGEYYKTLVMIDESFRKFLNSLYTGTVNGEARSDTDALSLAMGNIYRQYYGEKEYEKHTKAIKNAKNDLERAKEDYLLTFISTIESGAILTSAQKAACMRAYQDLYDALDELTEKDQKLDLALSTYGYALQNKSATDVENSFQTLFFLLYEEDEDRLEEMKAAREQLTTKQKELANLTSDWDRTVAKAERELAKAKEEYRVASEAKQRLQNQTFDYSGDTREIEKQLELAKRNAEDAAYALEQAKVRDKKLREEKHSKEQIYQINQQINELERKEKEKALREVEELVSSEGRVFAPVSGILLRLDLSVGATVSGTEMVSISREEYSFRFMVNKQEAKHLAIGDEIVVMPANNSKGIKTTLNSIGMLDPQDMAEITAILPEGEYGEGNFAAYTISKRSKQYQQTIPLQAVRMDAKQVNYVLVIGESNTSLGNERTAYRVNVNILDKDYRTAVVEALLGQEDNIIISSNRNIEEGDRVRIYEENE